MKRVVFFLVAAVTLFVSGCDKDNADDDKKVGTTQTVGLYVLSEGDWNAGNGQLVYFDYNSEDDQFVRNDNKRFQNFGDTPNDLIIYGAKMYAAIQGTGSDSEDGMVRVINHETGATIKDIVIFLDNVEQQPRRLASANGKLYVTLYSGAVAMIDTTLFTYQITTLSGTFSEGICVYGQSLYICNSGQGEENTVSVVDIATFTETEVIPVPYNPVNIVSAGNGELYINTATIWTGAAAGTPSNVHVLSANSKTITRTFDTAVESIAAGEHYVYGAGFDWNDFETTIIKINIADKSVNQFTDDANEYEMGYKLAVNPVTNEVFLTAQFMEQSAYRFKEDGTYIETLDIGAQNGSAIVFVNKVK